MLKKRSKVQKRLTKVVMAALLCTNAVQAVWAPSMAEATEITLTNLLTIPDSLQAVNKDGLMISYPKAKTGLMIAHISPFSLHSVAMNIRVI